MEEKELINRLRALHFIAGVLVNQQNDPRCSVCKSRAKVVEDAKEELEKLESNLANTAIPEPFERVYKRTKELFSEIKVPENPIPQRKEGRCFFAGEDCLIKKNALMFMRIYWERIRCYNAF
ncbi:MAG: hypothetical protein LM575_00995 [Caldimicrobium sp.]|nr:hypothetical protein [Caldimicrobium sp.]